MIRDSIFPTCLPVAPIDIYIGYSSWQWWDPTGSKPGDRRGRGEEPGDMETEVPGLTKDGNTTGAGKNKKKLHEHFFERLEVAKKERVKEKICS